MANFVKDFKLLFNGGARSWKLSQALLKFELDWLIIFKIYWNKLVPPEFTFITVLAFQTNSKYKKQIATLEQQFTFYESDLLESFAKQFFHFGECFHQHFFLILSFLVDLHQDAHLHKMLLVKILLPILSYPTKKLVFQHTCVEINQKESL